MVNIHIFILTLTLFFILDGKDSSMDQYIRKSVIHDQNKISMCKF